MFLKTAGLLVAFAAGFIEPDADVPSQWPDESDDRAFFRKTDDGTERIICPKNYKFDPLELICVRNETIEAKWHHEDPECVAGIDDDKPLCPDETFKGTLPYEPNCKCYKDCWLGVIEYLRKCQSYFVYHTADGGKCEEPENNYCCEYKEKNSNILV